MGHFVPAHTRDMQKRYGMGIGLNSMEGREAKYISISRYSQHTYTVPDRNRYFYMNMFPLYGFMNVALTFSYKTSYIPKGASRDPGVCYLLPPNAPVV